MYDEHAIEYLMKEFGTTKPGDCRHCIYQDNSPNRYTYQRLPCNNHMCMIPIKLKLFEAERKNINNIANKTSKFKVLGLKEEIVPPWIIMKDEENGGMFWLNVNICTSGTKVYKNIIPNGNMIICVTDTLLSEVCTYGVEVFSLECGNRDIASGIPNLHYEPMSCLYSIETSKGFVVCDAMDITSRQHMKVIISEHGNRLAVSSDDRMVIYKANGNIIVELPKYEQILRLTDRLEVINKTPSAIAIPL